MDSQSTLCLLSGDISLLSCNANQCSANVTLLIIPILIKSPNVTSSVCLLQQIMLSFLAMSLCCF